MFYLLVGSIIVLLAQHGSSRRMVHTSTSHTSYTTSTPSSNVTYDWFNDGGMSLWVYEKFLPGEDTSNPVEDLMRKLGANSTTHPSFSGAGGARDLTNVTFVSSGLACENCTPRRVPRSVERGIQPNSSHPLQPSNSHSLTNLVDKNHSTEAYIEGRIGEPTWIEGTLDKQYYINEIKITGEEVNHDILVSVLWFNMTTPCSLNNTSHLSSPSTTSTWSCNGSIADAILIQVAPGVSSFILAVGEIEIRGWDSGYPKMGLPVENVYLRHSIVQIYADPEDGGWYEPGNVGKNKGNYRHALSLVGPFIKTTLAIEYNATYAVFKFGDCYEAQLDVEAIRTHTCTRPRGAAPLQEANCTWTLNFYQGRVEVYMEQVLVGSQNMNDETCLYWDDSKNSTSDLPPAPMLLRYRLVKAITPNHIRYCNRCRTFLRNKHAIKMKYGVLGTKFSVTNLRGRLEKPREHLDRADRHDHCLKAEQELSINCPSVVSRLYTNKTSGEKMLGYKLLGISDVYRSKFKVDLLKRLADEVVMDLERSVIENFHASPTYLDIVERGVQEVLLEDWSFLQNMLSDQRQRHRFLRRLRHIYDEEAMKLMAAHGNIAISAVFSRLNTIEDASLDYWEILRKDLEPGFDDLAATPAPTTEMPSNLSTDDTQEGEVGDEEEAEEGEEESEEAPLEVEEAEEVEEIFNVYISEELFTAF